MTAAPGTVNDLTVTTRPDGQGGWDFIFSDSAGLTTILYVSCPGYATGQTYQSITCNGPPVGDPDFPPDGYSISIDVGDGDDRVGVDLGADLARVGHRVRGGDGNDDLFSDELDRDPAALGSLEGGLGNDRLTTGGEHSLKGEGGLDKLFAKNGVRNKASCGPGSNSKERAAIDKKVDRAISC